MKTYLIRWERDLENHLICVTDNPKEWLKENNKNRIASNEEVESLNTFCIIETELYNY